MPILAQLRMGPINAGVSVDQLLVALDNQRFSGHKLAALLLDQFFILQISNDLRPEFSLKGQPVPG
ncbi:MAG: hypothetical protein HLUCCX14_11545 [Marinobacter excellens HL-55]|uniref:Uncharacterized protein n=1 Tax=Marinobacter excellens HL-55 TaxID=1305731 RepID=A0A0P7Z1J5_9GAMM|nr:MAG: hypothetical protein HLUCCX14_11545 [Marinobacter excellens HL-55]